MTQFTYAQLEGLWIKAGGSKAAAPVAAAVAEAESSGRSNALSSNPDGGTNVGLWQLDTPGGKGGGYSVSQLEDPATNAAVAVKGSSNGRDWSAWETYVSGAYRAYMNGSTTPDTNVPGGGGSGGTSATLTSTDPATCMISMPSVNLHVTSVGGGCLLSKTNARALLGGLIVTGGIIIGGLGVLILAAQGFGRSNAAQKAATVAAVIPGGQPVAAGLQAVHNRSRRTGQQALASRRKANSSGERDGRREQGEQESSSSEPRS